MYSDNAQISRVGFKKADEELFTKFNGNQRNQRRFNKKCKLRKIKRIN